ncbi:MAG: PAS domain S-box protein [candidate division Zixibacteria bacterium]|nr:PAS domain S-box protein [candidate division Zixibacteria bacterium]
MSFLLIISVLLHISGAIWCASLWKQDGDWRVGAISLAVLAMSVHPALKIVDSYHGSEIFFEATMGETLDFTISLLVLLCVAFFGSFLQERQRTQVAFSQSEQRFETIFERAPVGAALVNQDMCMMKVNDELCNILGYEKTELAGTGFERITHPIDMADIIVLHRSMVEESNCSNHPLEKRLIRRDGSECWVMIRGASLPMSTNEGPLLLIQFVDITEKKLSELARAHAEEQYRMIFENSSGGLTIRSADGELIAANPAYCKMVGYTEAELKNIDPSSFIHPDSFPQFEEYLEAARPGGKFRSYVRDVCKDGSIIDVEVFGSHFMYNGEPHVLGVMHDVTDRRRAERALKITERQLLEQYELLEHYYRSAPVGLCYLDKNYRYVKINEVFAKINGHTVEEHIGKTPYDIVPEVAEYANKRFQKVLDSKKPLLNVELIVSSPGSQDEKRHLMLNYHPVLDENDDVMGVTVAAIDITDLKRTARLLETSEQRFKALYNKAPVMMHSVDSHFRLIDVNEAWLNKLGYTREEVLGRKPMEFLTEEFRKVAYEVGFPKLMADGSVNEIPYQMVTKDGKILDVELSARREVNQDNVFQFALATIVDVTERKRVEREHARLEERLLQSQKMESIGTLAGGIAHDFNNILAGILLCAESAATEVPSGSQVHEELNDIITSANRAGDLVRQILTFSRKAEGKQEPVNLDEIIREAFVLLKASLSENIRIELNLEPNVGTVLADPSHMTQIVMNLCSNALHAMKKSDGVLTVALNEEVLSEDSAFEHPELKPGRYVTLTVSDTGEGISEEAKTRMFEPFFSTKKVGEGVGLGLSVVHGIVLSCGGKIVAESEPHTGTTFKIYLPAFEGANKPEIEDEQKSELGSERILLVDDEEFFVRKAAQALKKLGHKVQYFTAPMRALEAFSLDADSFDIVITDYKMPDMNGLELSRELMNLRPNIPIILITGFDEGGIQAQGEMLGIRKFLMKPITANKLSDAIRNTLDSETKAATTINIS